MAKKTTRKTTSTKRTTSREHSKQNLWNNFRRSTGGKLVFYVIVATIVILLNILVSANDLSKFLLILGVELLLAFVVILLVLAWQQQNLDRE